MNTMTAQTIIIVHCSVCVIYLPPLFLVLLCPYGMPSGKPRMKSAETL